MLKRFREPVNGFTHLAAALVFALSLGLLIYLSRHSLVTQAAVTLYGISLVLMFSASATYHLVKAGPRLQAWLRKLDHSAIFLLIAGTYTPICLAFFEGFYRWGVLAIVWALALVGILLKLVTLRTPRWLNTAIYLLMGWLSLLAARQIYLNMPAGAIAWLVTGGVLFTIGAVIYVLKKPNFFPGVFGFHELWHIFVILGCLAHFILIALYAAPAPFSG